ncbi:hypothetical protein N7456_005254 [Penicillium angulare]|uniref:Uncharacterized protein n=1 Tax=Penicillium angulare TaxID=116970 RepID=A0A9W9FY02_9EURO|nr:hypothetical protein N7456_005254 [Penicillium angulare]
MYHRSELETQERPVELPNERSPSTPQAELPGGPWRRLEQERRKKEPKGEVESNASLPAK